MVRMCRQIAEGEHRQVQVRYPQQSQQSRAAASREQSRAAANSCVQVLVELAGHAIRTCCSPSAEELHLEMDAGVEVPQSPPVHSQLSALE